MKILVVEDNSLQAEDIVMQLEKLGHEPLPPVSTGAEAIAAVRKSKIDLVLMDIDLRGVINGIETTEIISKIKRTLPVIYLTILEEEAIFQSIQETPHLYFLPKPFNLSQLNKALKYVEAKLNDKAELETNLLEDSVFLKKNDLQYDRVEINDILWVEGGTNSITVVTKYNGKFVISGIFGPFTRKIKRPHIKRVHRSFLINLQHITAIKGNRLMIEDHGIPFSKTYVKNIKKLLQIITSSK